MSGVELVALLRTGVELNGLSQERVRIVHAALGDHDQVNGAVQNGNPGWYAVYACDHKLQVKDGGACRSKGFLASQEKRPSDGVSQSTKLRSSVTHAAGSTPVLARA